MSKEHKNLLIAVLCALLVASWIWPRFGLLSEPRIDRPPPPTVDPPPVEVPDESELAQIMEEMEASPGFRAAGVGLSVFTIGGEPVFSHRSEEAMTPASVLKTVTSATALERLGPDYRFETRLGSTAPFTLDETGAFPGDLILIGGGDPLFSSVTLAEWVRVLREKGLKHLRGRIIGDARWFPDDFVPHAWDWGDVGNYYGAGATGLNLDFNRFTVIFQPSTRVGDRALLTSMTPGLPWLERHLLVTTDEPGSEEWTSIQGGPYTSVLTFRGRVPLDAGRVSSRGAIPDPPYHAATQFSRMLALEGIDVQDEPTTLRRLERESATPPPEPAEILLTHASEPLREIVAYLHRTSDNMVTECLFQEISRRAVPPLSPREVITSHWKERGLTFEGLRMEDGSGLARADYIRPRDLAQILALASTGPQAEAFVHSLTPTRGGRIRWKGGAMSRVRSYAGLTDHGYTFAFLLNRFEESADPHSPWLRRVLDALLNLPAAGGMKPPGETDAGAGTTAP